MAAYIIGTAVLLISLAAAIGLFAAVARDALKSSPWLDDDWEE